MLKKIISAVLGFSVLFAENNMDSSVQSTLHRFIKDTVTSVPLIGDWMWAMINTTCGFYIFTTLSTIGTLSIIFIIITAGENKKDCTGSFLSGLFIGSIFFGGRKD